MFLVYHGWRVLAGWRRWVWANAKNPVAPA